MPKPRRTIRPIEKTISLPEDLVARVELELFSDLEQRVPFGAWSKLGQELFTRWVNERDFARANAALKEKADAPKPAQG